MAKKVNKTEEQFAQVESRLTNAALYIEKHKKLFSIAVGGIIVVFLGYLYYINFIVEPEKKEAANEMYIAQFYFERDSFSLALNGDGQFSGFLIVADRYPSTPSGNLANYYAAICQMNLGEYENAISSLNNFETNDQIISSQAIGLQGDANRELGNIDQAMNYYKTAATTSKNKFTTPYFMMKQASIHVEKGEYDLALNLYNSIKSDYSDSKEGSTIDKYIADVSNR